MYDYSDSALSADLWLLNSCTVKGPSEDGLKNAIGKGRELGKSLVVAGCVPQGQKNHPSIDGLSVVGVRRIVVDHLRNDVCHVATYVGIRSFLLRL